MQCLTGQTIPAPPVVEAVVQPVTEVAPTNPMQVDDDSFVAFTSAVPAEATPAAPEKRAVPSDKDVLVVSSLKDKPKKRSRPAAPTAGGSSGSAAVEPKKRHKKQADAAAAAITKEVLAPHDYSTNKSVLDAEPVRDKTSLSKKKKAKEVGRAAKGFVVDTSDFRREPRVNTAPKKGNVTKSFGSK